MAGQRKQTTRAERASDRSRRPMAKRAGTSAKQVAAGPVNGAGRQLTAAVAEQLLDGMRRDGLRPGARMPSEHELQNRLGVGRSTLREALRGLAMLGVLDIRHGHGIFVASDPALVGATDEIAAALSRGVTRVLLEARRPIEVEVARLAALRRTAADLQSLRSTLASHEQAVIGGRPAARWSAEFHLVLSEAAHNELLAGFVASYRRVLVERGPSLEQLVGYRRWELREHTELFDAVERQDADVAAARMLSHLDGVVDFYLRLGWPLGERESERKENQSGSLF